MSLDIDLVEYPLCSHNIDLEINTLVLLGEFEKVVSSHGFKQTPADEGPASDWQ